MHVFNDHISFPLAIQATADKYQITIDGFDSLLTKSDI